MVKQKKLNVLRGDSNPLIMKRRSKKSWKFSNYFGYKFWIFSTTVLFVVVIIFAIFFSADNLANRQVNDEALISEINLGGLSYTAASNPRFKGEKVKDMKEKNGHTYLSQNYMSVPPCTSEVDDLPLEFDARKKWPQCYEDHVPFDLINCAGSWAWSVSSSLADRICISDPDLYENLELSFQHIISCTREYDGCMGGFVEMAFKFASTDGIYEESCFPFNNGLQMPCDQKCPVERLHTISTICIASSESKIMSEIYTNGPVVALLQVHSDFLVYNRGVYNPMKTASMLIHSEIKIPMIQAVKILGWGTENSEPYWLIENSWGEDWGEKGYAKIGRNTTDVLYPTVIAGLPSTSTPYKSPLSFSKMEHLLQDDESDAFSADEEIEL